jgi:hypothetical protein
VAKERNHLEITCAHLLPERFQHSVCIFTKSRQAKPDGGNGRAIAFDVDRKPTPDVFKEMRHLSRLLSLWCGFGSGAVLSAFSLAL